MMYVHFRKCTYMYVHGMYMYVHIVVQTCMYITQTCMCIFILLCTSWHILNHIDMCIQCTTLFMECCAAHVQCTDGYIHFMKCADTAETCTYIDVSFWMLLFYLPCWLACRLGLAAAWCHAYSSSSSRVQSASA